MLFIGSSLRWVSVRKNRSAPAVVICLQTSPAYVPSTLKMNVALKSELDVSFPPSFQPIYTDKRDQWYAENTCDTHQDKTENTCVKALKHTQHIQWVKHEIPWWAGESGKFLAGMCCWSPCWLYQISRYMTLRHFKLKKNCTGFMDGHLMGTFIFS